MSNPSLIIPGPIQQTCWSSAGEFDAMISGCALQPTFGLVVRSATAPDVITYPIFKNFIWEDISSDPLVARYWNATMSSWDAQKPAAGSIVNSMIADHTILPVKFSVSGGNPGNVYRINAGGTDVIFDDPQNLFSAASPLQVGVLSKSPAGSYVLTNNGVAVPSWALVSSLFTAGAVPISAITGPGGTDKKVLGYNGSVNSWDFVQNFIIPNTVPVASLLPGPANNVPIVKADGSVVQWATPADLVAVLLPYVNQSYQTPIASRQSPPAGGASVTFPHGLGGDPITAGGIMVCTSVDGAFAVGDYFSFERMFTYGAGGDTRYYLVTFNSTNVILQATTSLGFAPYVSIAAGDQIIDLSKWKVGAWATRAS